MVEEQVGSNEASGMLKSTAISVKCKKNCDTLPLTGALDELGITSGLNTKKYDSLLISGDSNKNWRVSPLKNKIESITE
jgi:hypothetical protein